MDLVFSPRGNIIGDAAGTGLVHFYICDGEDALFLKEQWVSTPGNSLAAFDGAVAAGTPFIPIDQIQGQFSTGSTTDPYLVKDRRLVSVFTRTGAVKTSRVNGSGDELGDENANGTELEDSDGIANDPFLFAETGAQ